MTRGGEGPRLLDLFCGAGGCSAGYAAAGFDVTGVDAAPMPRYPYPFHMADAFVYLAEHGHEYDAIHASPPCQDHSDLASLTPDHGTGWMLPAMIDALAATGLPFVVENVARADLPGALVLCGSEFGLGAVCRDGVWRQLRRHRRFASNVFLMGAGGCHHHGQPVGVYGDGGGGQMTRGYKGTLAESLAAIGAPWMDRRTISQAIPPAYTEHIGRQLLDAMAAGGWGGDHHSRGVGPVPWRITVTEA